MKFLQLLALVALLPAGAAGAQPVCPSAGLKLPAASARRCLPTIWAARATWWFRPPASPMSTPGADAITATGRRWWAASWWRCRSRGSGRADVIRRFATSSGSCAMACRSRRNTPRRCRRWAGRSSVTSRCQR